MKRPDLGKARLQLGDQVGVGHGLVEQDLLLATLQLDPQVVRDDAPQRADGRADVDVRHGVRDRRHFAVPDERHRRVAPVRMQLRSERAHDIEHPLLERVNLICECPKEARSMSTKST